MSNIAHPHPDPPPLRALRALQGRGEFGVAIQICMYNRDFEQVIRRLRRNRPCNLFLHFLPCRAEDDFVHVHFFRLADGKEHAAGEARGGDFVGGVEVFHRAFGGF